MKHVTKTQVNLEGCEKNIIDTSTTDLGQKGRCNRNIENGLKMSSDSKKGALWYSTAKYLEDKVTINDRVKNIVTYELNCCYNTQFMWDVTLCLWMCCSKLFEES